MPFVKLDSCILTSTLWQDKPARDVFITSLLLAKPKVFDEEIVQLEVNSLKETGWKAPPGEYGYVDASGPGIVQFAGLDQETGLAALTRLGDRDKCSRSSCHEGRRMVRIDGGYVVLNYMAYREKDNTGAERQRRYRRNAVTASRNAVTVLHPSASASVEEKEGGVGEGKTPTVDVEKFSTVERDGTSQPQRDIEPPPGFPSNLEQAYSVGEFCGIHDKMFIQARYDLAVSRGYRDARNIPIRNFASHLKAQHNFAKSSQVERAKERKETAELNAAAKIKADRAARLMQEAIDLEV